MPGTPRPIINPAQGRVGTPIVNALQTHEQKLGNLAAAQQQGNTFDRWMNTMTLSGSNLNQVVTIGAQHGVGGVEVQTNLGTERAPAAGIAKQENLLTATIAYTGPNGTPVVTAGLSVTEGSTAATLDSSLAFAWAGASNYVIGASDIKTFSEAITPGTYIYAISGTSITLSQPAAADGTDLYCAACEFVLL